ncbi:MAG: hypothetical protein OQJ89_00040, partial [Kangiellaceae bacterium]|nr:hypothetical protein [Kangiellaceae bacterium]
LAGTGNDHRGIVDDALEKIGLSRYVQYKVANFSSAPYMVESSDAIFTAPRKFVEIIADKFDITAFETPVELARYSMKMYWHVKNKDDRAISWLRDQVFKIVND